MAKAEDMQGVPIFYLSDAKKSMEEDSEGRGCCTQGCGSGSGSGSVLDPYSIGSVDPDPESGSGSRKK